MPAVCPTVMTTVTPLPDPAGVEHSRVVADLHETVWQSELPIRAVGVRLLPAKFKPLIVTDPVPHVGVFKLI